MHTETVDYFDGDLLLKGFLAYEEGSDTKRPAVLVASAFRGLDDFAKERAIELAEQGYVAFAIDMYGEGKVTEDPEEASKLMTPFFVDRALLQRRALASCEYIKNSPLVDSSRIGAIGYCFGGLVVYELIRCASPLKGAVSFHGVLSNRWAGFEAKTLPLNEEANGSMLILHGDGDPYISSEDFQMLLKELRGSKIDWQIHSYGGALHAFTNPNASSPEKGIQYLERADKRSYRAMQNFLEEVLNY